ncbi:MAG TPA: hypothetical protein QGF63_15585 [Alphaproteobacteria bacterium]|nr:hypothetical protein [Alphaproteobacteria bacterium]MDP6271511.1 hypothetical protein [Alphaproteobacteria bacterium]MDP7429481.1 hypothetical protein [Alphaproteobacteria bacterium]HJM51252.1 hypothetical protein [Alphaproteobacteria bacterium]
MGGLAHYLEDEGVATTQISLIREHSEAMKPPRALWVPFELGRPLGAPGDAAFQRRVLAATLALLESDSGPQLVDHHEEAPPAHAEDSEGWVCPINLPAPEAAADDDLGAAMLVELSQMAPWYDLGLRQNERTTVGASGLEIEAAARFVASFLAAQPDPSPNPEFGPADMLKLATEDIKAFYFEAALSQPGSASSAEVNEWFWGQTAAAKVYFALHPVLAGSPDKALKTFAMALLIPRSQAHRIAG